MLAFTEARVVPLPGIPWPGSDCPRALGAQAGVPGSPLLFPSTSCNTSVPPCIMREEHILSLCHASGSVDDKHFLQQTEYLVLKLLLNGSTSRLVEVNVFSTQRLCMLFSWSCSKSTTQWIHAMSCPPNTEMSHEGTVNCSKVTEQSVDLEGFIFLTIIQVTQAREVFLYFFPSFLIHSFLWIILQGSRAILKDSGLWYLKSNSGN